MQKPVFRVEKVVRVRRTEGKHVIEVVKADYSTAEKVAIHNHCVTLLSKILGR
jgi:hypothetical protein